MLKNENIICISSIDWDFIWQGHQEIMATFARNGNRVFFVENTGIRVPGVKDISRIKKRVKNWFRGVKGVREEMENLYVFSPLVLPFPYSRIARWINRHLVLSVIERWMKIMDFNDPIIWTFLPTPLSLDIIEGLAAKASVYYCIDNLRVSSTQAKKIKQPEIKLLSKIDLVFVTSMALRNYCAQYNNKVYSFPFAVDFEKFERVRLMNSPRCEELANIKRPIIGYVGGIHKWIDQELVKNSAEKNLDYSFVFVGPIQTDISSLSKLKNVYFLGSKEHGKLPFLIKDFDLCVIPYLITEYTRNVYPTKLNEYLAMGKNVVSTALPEIVEFNKNHNNPMCIASGKEDFNSCIKKAISEDDPSMADNRIKLARKNSWTNRIEEMSGLIQNEIERKKLDRGKRWKEEFRIFYRKARRKAFKVGALFLLLYLLFFKTPFIWFLASPLRISDPLHNANAVIVFGGGVGETGSPGKSTIERARYAAELYNRGFAKKIVFSSGYSYQFNDAVNMRLVALSMGVNEKDIILEQKANSTYENVIFTKEVIDNNKWNTILLVSSPYNMRRAVLVFNRQRKGTNIICAPVPKSQFYDRQQGQRLSQISAIMHEYLGILYYLFKGYI